MKKIYKYYELYVIISLVFITIIILRLNPFPGYSDCEIYLAYTMENESSEIVHWDFNDGEKSSYLSHIKLSEQYHTSYCVLESSVSQMESMTITFPAGVKHISVPILTFICNGISYDYYPQDICTGFEITNCANYYVDGNGWLQIELDDLEQECTWRAKKSVLQKIEQYRK